MNNGAKAGQLKVGTFVKMLMAKKELSVNDVAESMETSTSNVRLMLKRGRITLNSLAKFMHICGEPVVLKLKDGQEVEIIFHEETEKNGKSGE